MKEFMSYFKGYNSNNAKNMLAGAFKVMILLQIV